MNEWKIKHSKENSIALNRLACEEMKYRRRKMQNRFQFRAWHTPTKKMFDVYAFNENFAFDNLPNSARCYSPNEYILMQCTGLKDRNGKLVYEGDIVEYTFNYLGASYQEKSKIIWSEKFSALFAQDSDGRLRHIPGKDEYEVIGNIYENPELLGGENE